MREHGCQLAGLGRASGAGEGITNCRLTPCCLPQKLFVILSTEFLMLQKKRLGENQNKK